MRQRKYVKIAPMKKRSEPIRLELLFRALADRTRLRLLNLMGDEEVCVCYFVEVLKTLQSKISRHLAYLRKAGIVGARRDGKWMHYRILEPSDRESADLLRHIRASVSNYEVLRKERSKLLQFCCGKVPEHLQDAPKPALITAV